MFHISYLVLRGSILPLLSSSSSSKMLYTLHTTGTISTKCSSQKIENTSSFSQQLLNILPKINQISPSPDPTPKLNMHIWNTIKKITPSITYFPSKHEYVRCTPTPKVVWCYPTTIIMWSCPFTLPIVSKSKLAL